jgi:hypothetical protein
MAKQKRIGMIALGAVFCLLFGAPSFAATVTVGDTIRFDWAPGHQGGFNGGAFTATVTAPVPGFSWYSFCVEKNEYINIPGTSFIVDSISGTAWNGGLGVLDPLTGINPAPGTGDPISSQTAYLYSLYATGGLGLTGPAGDPAQQTALQNVFWYLENEITTLPSGTLETQYYNLATSVASNSGFYGVAVVNPTYLNGTPAQSQLVYVPEAGALFLFGTGLVGLVGYRRIRRMQ